MYFYKIISSESLKIEDRFGGFGLRAVVILKQIASKEYVKGCRRCS
jgi:hypothetical protein